MSWTSHEPSWLRQTDHFQLSDHTLTESGPHTELEQRYLCFKRSCSAYLKASEAVRAAAVTNTPARATFPSYAALSLCNRLPDEHLAWSEQCSAEHSESMFAR